MSGNLRHRLDGVREMAKLPPTYAAELVEQIMCLPNNLGIRIEALQLTPRILGQSTHGRVFRILTRALCDTDAEVVRTALIAICQMEPSLLSREIFDDVARVLQSENTDLQYQAIVSLRHLRNLSPVDVFLSLVSPLINHPNLVVREMAFNARQDIRD